MQRLNKLVNALYWIIAFVGAIAIFLLIWLPEKTLLRFFLGFVVAEFWTYIVSFLSGIIAMRWFQSKFMKPILYCNVTLSIQLLNNYLSVERNKFSRMYASIHLALAYYTSGDMEAVKEILIQFENEPPFRSRGTNRMFDRLYLAIVAETTYSVTGDIEMAKSALSRFWATVTIKKPSKLDHAQYDSLSYYIRTTEGNFTGFKEYLDASETRQSSKSLLGKVENQKDYAMLYRHTGEVELERGALQYVVENAGNTKYKKAAEIRLAEIN